MKETVLKSFFEGEIDGASLSADLVDAVKAEGKTSHHYILDMAEQFEVKAPHLVLLCDSVLNDELDPKHLETIGFCLVASDAFNWDTDVSDGKIIAETCWDWSDPTINYPLTKENVAKFRERLLTGEDPFRAASLGEVNSR